MKILNNAIQYLMLALTAFALLSFDLPKGWIIAGSSPTKYEMGIDKGSGQDGNNAGTIKSIPIEKSIDGFGTLMQHCRPDKFAGKIIKLSAMVKSSMVTDWSGLWFRIDQTGSKEPLSFDNMYNRPIKGTTDWKQYAIVLDVPSNASMIAFGVLLSGTGQIWFDNLTFEIVVDPEKTTDSNNLSKPTNISEEQTNIPEEPTNLNFEKD